MDCSISGEYSEKANCQFERHNRRLYIGREILLYEVDLTYRKNINQFFFMYLLQNEETGLVLLWKWCTICVNKVCKITHPCERSWTNRTLIGSFLLE